MAVEDEKMVSALCTGLSMFVEVLDPFKPDTIVCPSVLANSNRLIVR